MLVGLSLQKRNFKKMISTINHPKFSLKEVSLLLFCIILCFDLTAQHIHQENTKSIAQESLHRSDANNMEGKKTIIPQLLFSGLLFQNQEKKQTWYIPALFELFPPNTVEGFVSNLQVSFTQHLKNGKFFNLKPGLRYGFGNKRLQAQLAAQFYYNPSYKASVQLSGGRFVEQFNKEKYPKCTQ